MKPPLISGEPIGWIYEDSDSGVGIFAEGWLHEDCKKDVEDFSEEEVLHVQVCGGGSDRRIISWIKFTCPACHHYTVVVEEEWDPVEEEDI